MANYQVVAIRKSNQKCTLEQITHVAYIESFFNSRVIITVEEAIRRIMHNKKEFYVRSIRNLDYVEVVKSDEGVIFIKTRGDKIKTDHLLSLQEC